MEDKKISIIIPVYNAEKYIDRAVNCVLMQTYKNWELILVDNCSNDSTVDKCKEWIEKDNRIIGVFHNENMGIGQSRTDGIAISTGDYIGFMDVDDYIHPQMYEIMVKTAAEKNAEIVMCNAKMHQESEKIDFKSIDKNITTRTLKLREIYQEMFSKWPRNFPHMFVWNKLIKSEVAKMIKVLFYGGEDLYFSFQAYNIAERITIVDTPPLYYWIQRGDSETHKDFNLRNVQLLQVRFWIDKDVYENKKIFYGLVAERTYKDLLIARAESKNSLYNNEVKCVFKSEFSEFQKRFLKCKGVTLKSKLILSLLWYCPILYEYLRRR